MARKRSSSVSYQETSSVNFIISAKNQEQKDLIRAIQKNTVTIVRGPSGCGKTYIAATYAMQQFLQGKYERLVFTRPAIEAAGERLGYLPGDILEKIDPYMMPIYESLLQIIPSDLMNKLLPRGRKDSSIRIIPLAYMRGATFNNSLIIADEMQNARPEQFRLLLTRLGEHSKMIICGDTRQSDIYEHNGLQDAFDLLGDIDDIGFISMSEDSIVRHPLIQKIENRYEERAIKRKKNASPPDQV